MTLLPPTRFDGTLESGDKGVAAAFEATVNARGELDLTFEPIPAPRYMLELSLAGNPGGRVKYASLSGVGPSGEELASTTFFVAGSRTNTEDDPPVVSIRGHCGRAEIRRALPQPFERPQLLWHLRQFQVGRPLRRDTSVGTVVASGGEPNKEDPQELTGFLGVQASSDTVADGWWDAAYAMLDHVARVMSLAVGRYLTPYVERRINGSDDKLLVWRRADADVPFLPPFHWLNLRSIFERACDSAATHTELVKKLDPAFQWYCAPASYNEIRLVAAMTALEHVLSHSGPKALMPDGAFRKLTKQIRGAIDILAHPSAAALKERLPELNRPSFADKLTRYLAERGIPIDDLPEDGIRKMIRARNAIVHRGTYYDKSATNQADIWEHIHLARELVARILLDVLGFTGNYFSYLHGHRQLSFPSCKPVG